MNTRTPIFESKRKPEIPGENLRERAWIELLFLGDNIRFVIGFGVLLLVNCGEQITEIGTKARWEWRKILVESYCLLLLNQSRIYFNNKAYFAIFAMFDSVWFIYIVLPFLPSDTITMNWQDALLPELSTNVYFTGVAPTGKPSPGECVTSLSLTSPDASNAEGSIHVTDVCDVPISADSWKSDGQPIILGGVVSSVNGTRHAYVTGNH